ncbi:MAG: VRR-NUC domain-containing protein [Solirubrobacteraceae bacterium]
MALGLQTGRVGSFVGEGLVSVQALKQTEKQFQTAVVEYAELNGWLVYHTYDSRRSNPGFPDLVMARGYRLVFAELKSEKGRESRAQTEWLDALGRATPEVWLWRPSDWPEIEGVLAR